MPKLHADVIHDFDTATHNLKLHGPICRGHLLKREVWERPVATLDRGDGVQIEHFSDETAYYATVPRTSKSSLQLWERSQNCTNFFHNLLYENQNFHYFWQLFFTFLRRYGYSVPTRSLRK